MKLATRFALLLLPLLSSSMAYGATPSITTVYSQNGSTITNEAVLVFEGSNFGALAQVKPLAHGHFHKNINPSSFSYLSTWDENSNMAWTTDASGLAGAVGTSYGMWASSATARAFHFMIDHQTPYQQIYAYQRRWASAETSPNRKFFRIWRNGTQGPNDFVASTDSDGVCFNESETGDTPGIGGAVGGYQPSKVATATWYNNRYIWHRTGVGTGKDSDGGTTTGGTGVWDALQNGAVRQHRENVRNYQDLLTELVLGDFTDGAHLEPDGTIVKFASIWVSTVAHAVFLSTHSTFSAAKFDMQPQPMLIRTDTATVIVVDRTGIDTSKQVYGYVMGASTTDVNANGFAIDLTLTNTNLAPTVMPVVGVSSFSVIWSSVPGTTNNFVAAMSATSDFSTIITSGALNSRSTSYANLAQTTTYYFKVKIATEPDSGYNSTISTVTLWTNLAPSIGSNQQTSLTGSWVGGMTITRSWDDNSDFSSTISSGSATSPDTQGSLTCNTQYYFAVKVATETSYGGNFVTGNTSACSQASGASSINFKNVQMNNVRMGRP